MKPLLIVGLIVGVGSGATPAHAQAPAPPAKRAKSPQAPAREKEARTAPTRPVKRPLLHMRSDERKRPRPADMGEEDAVPPLETDPFRPPKGSARAPDKAGKAGKPRPWFVRPAILFMARFAKNRSFVPREGFGFGFQAGATLGRSTLRLGLAVAYHFYRLARTMDIVVNDPELTSCTSIRTFAYHLVTGSAQAVARFSKMEVFAGLRGGFAHSQLKTPTSTCDTDDGSASTGVLGPELGIAYALRADLFLGVSLAYLHFFSDKAYVSPEGTSHRYFYDMLTVGAALTLRF